ncbi:short chain dehydrogenase [Hyaloraphidium curvatum]|nr:short chain dehydrogenase [Hyaloraphidium curvatum]
MSAKLFSLEGDVAFVTGAGSGIGQRLAVGLAEAGADVACFDLNTAGMDETVAKITALGRKAVALAGNVTVRSDLDAAVVRAELELGAITCAVNCAGVVDAAPSETMPFDQWKKVLSIDLDGIFLTCQALAQVMLPRQNGRIVNIASISGTVIVKDLYQAHYNAAKAGVVQLSKSLAAEWATRGVRCNTISPGFTMTPMNTRPDVASAVEGYTKLIPMDRWAQTDDLVGPAVFLCSKASSYVTGHDLICDGGFTLW